MRNLGIALVLFASACVAEGTDEIRPDEEAEDWRSGGKADGESCDFDAMPAAAYYDLFNYEQFVSESGSSWYRVGLTWDVQGTVEDGNKVDLDVYFLDGDRVIAEYSEQKYIGGGQSEVLNETVIVTRRVIDPDTRSITIVGVGSGTPFTTTNSRGQCMPSINFEFSSDLRTPGLVGDTTHITAGLTSAFVIDPDHLDDVPHQGAREYFEEKVASGRIKILRF